MRVVWLLMLVACAPVVATVTPVGEDLPDGPGPPERTDDVVWSGTWLPTALDRLVLQGDDGAHCLQLVLVSPGAWDGDLPVDVSEPWTLEGAVDIAGPCPDGSWGAGAPLQADQIEGRIEVDPAWPPEQVVLDLRVEVAGAAWDVDTVVELDP